MLPTLAQPSRQLELLSVQPVYNIPTNAHARNAYGCAAQEIVCAAMGLRPIPIDGSKEICFDAATPDESRHFEIKSVHNNAKIVIYNWRMTKEAKVPSARYIILKHRVRRHRDGHTLFQAFADGGLECWVLSMQTVHHVAQQEPSRILLAKNKEGAVNEDPRNGYNRAGYRDGYRNVPMKKFLPYLRNYDTNRFELYGIPFKVPVLVEIGLGEP